MNLKQAKELVRGRLSDKRYEHTLNVRKMAVKLAKRYGVDEDKAALAALLERLEREYHKKRIYLSVVEANRPAAALYESFGFRFTGERDTHGERVMCLRTR